MDDPRASFHPRRNERVVLTEDERRAIDDLHRRFDEQHSVIEEALKASELNDVRTEMAAEARALLAKAIPDFDAQAEEFASRYKPRYAGLKQRLFGGGDGIGINPTKDPGSLITTLRSPWLDQVVEQAAKNNFKLITDIFQQPAFVGEFWWAELFPGTSGAATGPIAVDISGDPQRIFGHIGYDDDNLIGGSAGLTTTFILSSDRLPITSKTNFEVRPQVRTEGIVSGWTGLYHPLWHADDKWSKCWELRKATLSTSTGILLDEISFSFPLFELANVNPVGQANSNRFEVWSPILRASFDTFDFRARGVSLILTVQLRYDFQLEGESDIWFRNRGGSSQESVPAFDNALTFRCMPGSLIPAS